MQDESVNAQSTFQDWEGWFTLRGLYLDSSTGAAAAYRSLAPAVTLDDMGVVWDWVQAKHGLDSPESYFMSQVSKPSAFKKLVGKVRMFQTEGVKPASRNQNPNRSDYEREMCDEWIAAVIQERRTVDWVMRAETMFRTEVIEVLKRLAPYALTEEMYEGPASPWDLPEDIKENWRREDEAELIKAERVELFAAAIERKRDRRVALGRPVPGETPEELTVEELVGGQT